MKDPLTMTSPELVAEVRRLREEVRSLRASLGELNGAEPVGCPCPGACSSERVIATARREALDRGIYEVVELAAHDCAERDWPDGERLCWRIAAGLRALKDKPDA